MAALNHFAVSAAMGSTLGPKAAVLHGQIGSSQMAATLSTLLRRRSEYIDELTPQDSLTQQYEKAVTRAFLHVRQGFSSDRVLADPAINAAFIKTCRDLGLDDSVFHLNLALIGLRKHSKLKFKSRSSVVREQWRYAVASEIAARIMHYRYGASVDTTLAHPNLVREFDHLASSISPGYSPFEYRWAALNMRKKGSNVKVKGKVIQRLEWSDRLAFEAQALPPDEGVYTLFERRTCLFVAATEDIEESIGAHRRIAEVPLFPPELWRPDPEQLSWRYVQMPDSSSDYRFGVVRSLVWRFAPVFNIPRGKRRKTAA